MNVVSFTAASAPDAVAQIKARLGPDAVVLNVRQLPAEGLSRLWQKPRIEVLACLPDGPGPNQGRDLEASPPGRPNLPFSIDPSPEAGLPLVSQRPGAAGSSGWRVGRVLENMGLLPAYSQSVLEELKKRHGREAPPSVVQELAWTRAILLQYWRQVPEITRNTAQRRIHLLVGAAGAGKTTCLCKWLTQAVLVDGCSAQVWRLDGRTANTAESLSVYGEILGLTVER